MIFLFSVVLLTRGTACSPLEVFVLYCYAYFFQVAKENLMKVCNSKDCETKLTE